MKHHRPLATSVTAVGLFLILIPLFQLALALAPFELGSAAWRFGAAGLLSTSATTLTMGFLLLYGSAALLEARAMLVGLAGAAWAGTAFLAGALVMFGLDGLQIRPTVSEEAREAFNASFLRALLTYLTWLLAAIALGLSATRSARIMKHQPRPGAPSKVVVGQPPT